MAPLKELSAVSKTLNDESNRVNALLKEVERKLCALNLGVEAWVGTLSEKERVETYVTERGEEAQRFRSYDVVLGFGQIGDRWALLVRNKTYEKPSVDHHQWVEVDEERPTALLEAPRLTRIAALGKIDALVDALTKNAERMVQTIKAAEETVKNL